MHIAEYNHSCRPRNQAVGDDRRGQHVATESDNAFSGRECYAQVKRTDRLANSTFQTFHCMTNSDMTVAKLHRLTVDQPDEHDAFNVHRDIVVERRTAFAGTLQANPPARMASEQYPDEDMREMCGQLDQLVEAVTVYEE